MFRICRSAAGGVVHDDASGFRSRRRRSWKRWAARSASGGPIRRRRKIPVVRFGKDDRKIEVMHRYLAEQAKTGGTGVAAIGVAQEFAPVFTGTKKTGPGDAVWFAFTKADRRVTCYYFYIWDDDFGPGFVKVCAYFPYPMKIWLNGHEWAKRQAAKAGIGFTELSNGFASATDPVRCRRSVTGWARARSGCSPNAGGRSCRCR